MDWRRAKIADVGAGRGYFTRLLCERLRAERVDPVGRVLPCDADPSSFEWPEVDCREVGAGGRLPYRDEEVDAAVSIEVIEHVEDQFAFLRELRRIVRPGGTVIVTTPNTANMNSRLRGLLAGFPVLFDPLPLSAADPRRLGGHIHPIGPYYLAYAALRAGLAEPRLYGDRRKRSATAFACLLWPAVVAGRWSLRRRLIRKQPEVWRQNQQLLAMVNGWELLTSRSVVLVARRT